MKPEISQYKVNLPLDVKDWLKTRAEASLRSQSAEMVFILREKMAAEQATTQK